MPEVFETGHNQPWTTGAIQSRNNLKFLDFVHLSFELKHANLHNVI